MYCFFLCIICCIDRPRNIKKEWSKIAQRQTPHFAPTNMHQKIDVMSSITSPVNVNHIYATSNKSNSYGQHFQFDKSMSNGHNSQNSKSSAHVILEEHCPYYIGQCVNIERIIFVMKYYRLWREYKQQQYNNNNNNNNIYGNNGYQISKFSSVLFYIVTNGLNFVCWTYLTCFKIW